MLPPTPDGSHSPGPPPQGPPQRLPALTPPSRHRTLNSPGSLPECFPPRVPFAHLTTESLTQVPGSFTQQHKPPNQQASVSFAFLKLLHRTNGPAQSNHTSLTLSHPCVLLQALSTVRKCCHNNREMILVLRQRLTSEIQKRGGKNLLEFLKMWYLSPI